MRLIPQCVEKPLQSVVKSLFASTQHYHWYVNCLLVWACGRQPGAIPFFLLPAFSLAQYIFHPLTFLPSVSTQYLQIKDGDTLLQYLIIVSLTLLAFLSSCFGLKWEESGDEPLDDLKEFVWWLLSLFMSRSVNYYCLHD